MTANPADPRPLRDRDFERRIHDGFNRLVEDFVARGFKRNEARLWVGAWRHMDNPADLARTALAFRHLRVPVGQAIPWYWERIPPQVARRYLPYGWRAADARRVMQALRHQDPTLTRGEALALGLRWADAEHTANEALELISFGYDLDTAIQAQRHLLRETISHGIGNPGEPSSLKEWAQAGIAPEWVVRYLAAGVVHIREAQVLEAERRQGTPDAFAERLAVLAALHTDGREGW